MCHQISFKAAENINRVINILITIGLIGRGYCQAKIT